MKNTENWINLPSGSSSKLHGADVFLEELVVAQVIKKSSACYGTRKFIAVFRNASPLTLFLNQTTPATYFFDMYLNIIFPFVPMSLTSGLIPSGSPTKMPYVFVISP
jgi:hypothetical protein